MPELKEGKNLLLVDDTELFLAMEQSFLERREFILHTARSGSEALEKAKTIKPDLIRSFVDALHKKGMRNIIGVEGK